MGPHPRARSRSARAGSPAQAISMWLEVPSRRVPGSLVLSRGSSYFPEPRESQAAAFLSGFLLHPCATLTPDQVSDHVGSFQKLFFEVLLTARLCARF